METWFELYRQGYDVKESERPPFAISMDEAILEEHDGQFR